MSNTHESGIGGDAPDKDGAEIKLGFTLDYVTGLPVIPGSTVKGVLHGAFEHHGEYVADEVLKINSEDVDGIKSSL